MSNDGEDPRDMVKVNFDAIFPWTNLVLPVKDLRVMTSDMDGTIMITGRVPPGVNHDFYAGDSVTLINIGPTT